MAETNPQTVELVVMSEDGNNLLPLTLSSTTDLGTILQQIALETQTPAHLLVLMKDGRALTQFDSTLEELGINSSTVLTFKKINLDGLSGLLAGRGGMGVGTGVARGAPRSNSQPAPLSPHAISEIIAGLAPSLETVTLQDLPAEYFTQPALLHAVFKAAPHLMTELRAVNPQMAQAAAADTPGPLADYLRRLAEARAARERALWERQRKLELDPMNVELQREIEEEIRLQNVERNLELAMEYTPEAFGSVYMLYVPMVVNGTPLKAFVDSGAQTTIMSEACAQKCGIMRLIDRRFSGIAKGVGTSKILGRVHAVPVRVGNLNITCSFTILENQDMDFLFGLDQLRAHQAIIDLKQNVLIIRDEVIPFLAEKDIPKEHRSSQFEEGAEETQKRQPKTVESKSESDRMTAGPSPAPGAQAAGAAAAAPPPPPPAPPIASSSSSSSATQSSSPAQASRLSPAAAQAGQLFLSLLQSALANPSYLQHAQQGASSAAPVPTPAPQQARQNPGGQQPQAALSQAATPSQPQSQAQSQQAQQPHAAQRTSYPQETVQALMSLGFSEAQVLRALEACGGDGDLAAALLLQNS